MPQEALLLGVVIGGDKQRCIQSLHSKLEPGTKKIPLFNVFTPEAEK